VAGAMVCLSGSHSKLDFVGVRCAIPEKRRIGALQRVFGVELFRRRIVAHSPTYSNAARRTTEPTIIIIISPTEPLLLRSQEAAFPSTDLWRIRTSQHGTVSL
jgi:hypothetical protein